MFFTVWILAPFALLALFVIALALWNRLIRLETQFRALNQRFVIVETTLSSLERRAARSVGDAAPPLPRPTAPEVVEPPPPTDSSETIPPVASPTEATEPGPSVPPVTPPPYVPPPPAPVASEAPPPASLEERLGTQWAVYLGGAAIALGGIFLVRHAIEAGWLGPAARIILGLVLGAALVAAGTRMRLSETHIRVANIGGAHIPSVLTAVGTVILFATLYAAYALYGFIGAGTAFVLLGAVGIGTMLSAAIHGPALAGLGLVGAYVTPLLVQTSEPNPWALVIYLTVVTAAALTLARIRSWLWLTYTAIGGGALWALILTAGSLSTWHLPLMVHILIQSAIAAVIVAIEPNIDRDEEAAQPDLPAIVAFAVLSAITAIAFVVVPNDNTFYLPFALLMLGLLAATAHIAPPAAALNALAGLLLAVVLIDWPGVDLPPDPKYFYGAPPNLIRLPENVSAFLSFATLVAAGLAAIATWALWTRPRLPIRTTGLFALGATIAPLLALAVSYLRVTQFGNAISFTLIGAALAAGFAYLAERFLVREDENAGLVARIPTGAFAAAAIAALSIAMVAGLQRGYLTVAFALAALGVAYVSSRKDIPVLRGIVTALGLIVLGRIVWDPRIMGADVGSTPVFNWLLVGYGVPAIAFWQASSVLRQRRTDLASHVADALALIFFTLLMVFEIRHYVHGGDPLAATSNHLEMGLYAILFLGLSHALMHLARARRTKVFEVAHLAAAALAALTIVFGLGLGRNPLFTNEAVGGGIPFSTLLVAYLLPGLMALYIARHARDRVPPWYVMAAAVAALALIFGYVTLEVRHGFHGAHIGMFKRVLSAEMWGYTVAWLVLAIIYLAYGLLRNSLPARAASGLLLAVAVVKVGLFDLAGVTGIWRALSFLCLGGVLIGIGLVYQKLVFGRRGGDEGLEAGKAEGSA
jgi:uncharacterized membrane protein